MEVTQDSGGSHTIKTEFISLEKVEILKFRKKLRAHWS